MYSIGNGLSSVEAWLSTALDILWHLWIGRARHPGPSPSSQHFGLEVFNVGGVVDSWGFSFGG